MCDETRNLPWVTFDRNTGEVIVKEGTLSTPLCVREAGKKGIGPHCIHNTHVTVLREVLTGGDGAQQFVRYTVLNAGNGLYRANPGQAGPRFWDSVSALRIERAWFDVPFCDGREPEKLDGTKIEIRSDRRYPLAVVCVGFASNGIPTLFDGSGKQTGVWTLSWVADGEGREAMVLLSTETALKVRGAHVPAPEGSSGPNMIRLVISPAGDTRLLPLLHDSGADGTFSYSSFTLLLPDLTGVDSAGAAWLRLLQEHSRIEAHR